jgi:hypothetical protein
MSNEEERTVEEIEAEYIGLMSDKVEKLKADKAVFEAAEALKSSEATIAAAVEAAKLQWEEEQKKTQDAARAEAAGTTVDPLGDQTPAVDTSGTVPENKKVVDLATKWLDGRGIKMEDVKPYSAAELNASGNNMNQFVYTDSDTGCEDNVTAWSPVDVWCNSIWYAVQCKSVLAGKVTVRACDISKGDGLTVQIRTIGADTFPAALGPCECGSCVSNSFDSYSLTLARYDLYKVMCNLDEWDVGEVLPVAMAETMVRCFSLGIDGLIYAALVGATPTYTETLASDAICDPARQTNTNCCTYATELYTSIIQLEADMRSAGYGQEGFVLILHPTVALYLKYKEGINPPPWVNNITMEGNEITSIGKIRVIELCGANDCTNVATGNIVGVLFDPTRAVGEAYGKKPHLKKDEDPIECDSWKFVYRMYIAVAALDQAAIGHILQP